MELDPALWSTLLTRDASCQGRVMVPGLLLYQVLRHLDPAKTRLLSRTYNLTVHYDPVLLASWFINVLQHRLWARCTAQGVLFVMPIATMTQKELRVCTFAIGRLGIEVCGDMLRQLQRTSLYGDGQRWIRLAMLGVTIVCCGVAALAVMSASRTGSDPATVLSEDGGTPLHPPCQPLP